MVFSANVFDRKNAEFRVKDLKEAYKNYHYSFSVVPLIDLGAYAVQVFNEKTKQITGYDGREFKAYLLKNIVV